MKNLDRTNFFSGEKNGDFTGSVNFDNEYTKIENGPAIKFDIFLKFRKLAITWYKVFQNWSKNKRDILTGPTFFGVKKMAILPRVRTLTINTQKSKMVRHEIFYIFLKFRTLAYNWIPKFFKFEARISEKSWQDQRFFELKKWRFYREYELWQNIHKNYIWSGKIWMHMLKE